MANAAAPAPKANMGQPIERVDARLKVTGEARYPSDIKIENPAYAVLVTSAIASGAVNAIDRTEAEQVAGLVGIYTHEELGGKIKQPKMMGDASDPGYACSTHRPMDSAKIFHDGQILAIVVADTFEAASEAAAKLKLTYARKPASASFESPGVTIEAAAKVKSSHEDPKLGDARKALETAEIKIDQRYSTPPQVHNPIELFTTTTVWNGDKLTIHEPSQTPIGLRFGVAQQLGIDPDNVHVISHFIGGAFGSKGATTERTALIALVSRDLGRPLKLVGSREQSFFLSTYRAETQHRVALAAFKDGRLSALIHEGMEVTSRDDGYFVGGTDATARMYACPNIETKVSIVHADRKTPGFMRAPAEVPYMFALESAMDELAEKLGMDPVELRRINDITKEPIKGLDYTSRSLMTCFDEASKAFGWTRRNAKPGATRDGDWLIGMGCATSCYPVNVAPAMARVYLSKDGKARVETGAQDVGTGTYTVVAQTAAERLGIDPKDVVVRLGDSDLPPAPVSGGSNVTASVCSVVAKACDALKAKLNQQNLDLAQAFEKLGVSDLEEYAELVGPGEPEKGIGLMKKGISALNGGAKLKDRIQFSFGAQFVEVAVHSRTKEIRVRRMVGAFAAGRIMNPRTARSQLMGGMIGGLGSALLEEAEVEPRTARIVNKNLADYEVPVNADVNDLDVILVSETDTKINLLGIKGVGELGIVGTAAAVANAVYNATGTRVRNLPIRLDALLA